MKNEGRRQPRHAGIATLARLNFRIAGLLACWVSLHAGAISSLSVSGDPTTINFDDLTGGTCNLCGPSVANQYSGMGVTFRDPTYPGDDRADANLTRFIPNASPPNVLFVEQGGMLGDKPAAPFEILFSVPVKAVGFDFGSSFDSFLQLNAYGADGRLLDSLTFMGSFAPIGLAGFAGIEESSPIKRLDISYHPNASRWRTLNFSIDNLTFTTDAVPEPPASLLLLIGLVPLAWGLRRRRARPSQEFLPPDVG